MKVELTSTGLLIVTAETGIESYALSYWFQNFQVGTEKSTFTIDSDFCNFKTERPHDS
jgi:hypothetical protein